MLLAAARNVGHWHNSEVTNEASDFPLRRAKRTQRECCSMRRGRLRRARRPASTLSTCPRV